VRYNKVMSVGFCTISMRMKKTEDSSAHKSHGFGRVSIKDGAGSYKYPCVQISPHK